MANNYTQFSFEVEATPAQASWLLDAHSLCNAADGTGNDRPADDPRFAACQTLIDQCYAGDLCPSVEIEAGGPGKLWFHADECGDVEYTADLLAAMLEAFDSSAILSFAWANTCSKMRLDEFDGGAAVITKDCCNYLSASRWIDARIAEIEAARTVTV